jgi:hypothetical protein
VSLAGTVARSELIARSDWYRYAHADDGSTYVSWRGVGDFLVSGSGDRILWAPDGAAPRESLEVYLLGHALSFALVKAGFEPLHGTAIESGGSAIALLGDSGFGKSTLAASFIVSGCRLLTDDMLVLRSAGASVEAFPGPPRVKLLPDSATHSLGPAARGVPMNPVTEKEVFPLDAASLCSHPVHLRTIYILAPPTDVADQRLPRIEPMPPGEAFLALVRNTFNRYIDDPARLQRQFLQTSRVLEAVTVRKLSYPRRLAHLADVRAAIMADGGWMARRTA